MTTSSLGSSSRAVVVASLSLALAGCGGGLKKIIDDIKGAVGAGGGAGGGAGAAAPPPPKSTQSGAGNAYLIRIGDVTKGTVTAKSPDTGVTVTLTPGAWTETMLAAEPDVPDWIANDPRRNDPSVKLFKRTLTSSSASAGGVPAIATAELVQYGFAPCAPGSAGCNAKISASAEAFVARQIPAAGGSAVVVTEATVQVTDTVAGAKPVDLTFREVDTERNFGTNGADLQHAYVGTITDGAVSFTIKNFTNDDMVIKDGSFAGAVTTGVFFGGTPTPGADMSSLKSRSVEATYIGRYEGFAFKPGAMPHPDSSLGNSQVGHKGTAQLTARFGPGTITGNVFGLKREDGNGAITDAPYGVRIDGAISGHSYSGTAKYTDAATAAGAAARSGSPTGQVLGGFFGPAAAETAGILRIEGDAPGTGGGTGAGVVLLGRFGGQATMPLTGAAEPLATDTGAGKGFFFSVTDVKNLRYATRSPDSGQSVAIGKLADERHPEDDPASNQTVAVRSVTVTGSPVSVAASDKLHEQVFCTGQGCQPQSDREFRRDVDVRQQNAQGQWVTTTKAEVEKPENITRPVQVSERNLMVRTGTGPNGTGGPLKHAYYGEYSDVTLEGTLRLDGNGNIDGLAPNAGKINALGYFFGGNATSASDMSDLKRFGVEASYAGQFRGIAVKEGSNVFANGSEPAELEGDAQLKANFGSGAVAGKVTSLVDRERRVGGTDQNPVHAPVGYGIGFNGTIASGASTYSGAAKFTNPDGSAAAGTSSGQAVGGFFGPGAAETAGAIRVQGTAPGQAGTTLATGSFGAKKQ
jgi:hypothetical protein